MSNQIRIKLALSRSQFEAAKREGFSAADISTLVEIIDGLYDIAFSGMEVEDDANANPSIAS